MKNLRRDNFVKKYLIGIDIGTQSVRVVIFDFHGNYISSAYNSHETLYPRAGWAEQNPLDWLTGMKVAMNKALSNGNVIPEEIAGISIDTFSCTVLPVDMNGNPLDNALIWMDVRATKEAIEISSTNHDYLSYSGGWVSPEWMLPKALWLKRNKPALYKASAKIIECTDWVTFKLTGKWTLSMDHISSKWNYVSSKGGFPDDLLNLIGLEDLKDKWPREIKSLGDYVGGLTNEAAKELGLVSGIPVSQGGIDAHLGMLGLGAIKPNEMALIMGSSNCHLVVSQHAAFAAGIWGPFEEAILPQTWLLEGGQSSSGSIIKWFHELDEEKIGKDTYQLMDRKISSISPGSEGLLALDYWQGNRSPYSDPKARGMIWGLSLKHTKAHIIRSIYEASAYGTRQIIESLKTQEVPITKIIAGGGGARSKIWLQIQSDICQLPVYTAETDESMALGAAMCASVGAGVHANLREAVKVMSKEGASYKPEQDSIKTYDYYYNAYKKTYTQMKDLMHDMHRHVNHY